ncbi:multiple C2 and transmembrane domain-containing protein isoform X2 [Hylaeus anthracinus]|uniref:multiple C2 and transmembrane domain-containing protein isoform X2 n=1 Tax=Hylaeus anthracinus TaxID=313031 RepID=UPI0023B919E9|nr:multiple C2 and transmembrane domain-containing protein isoform X2 [Hylaeus anthracinus]
MDKSLSDSSSSISKEDQSVPRKDIDDCTILPKDELGTEEHSEDRESSGNDQPAEIEARSHEPRGAPKTPRRGLKRRDRVGDNAKQTLDSENTGRVSSKKKSTEEIVESRWRRFWESNRDRFKHKPEEDVGKYRAAEDVAAEADAVFREAIEAMRFDETCDERSESSNRTKPFIGREDRDGSEVLAADQGVFENRPEEEEKSSNAEKDENTAKVSMVSSESNFFVALSAEKHAEIRNDPSSRRWSSLENLRAKMEKAGSFESKICRSVEGLSIEKPAKIKEKRTIGSLKSSFERKMGSVERMLEDHMGRILEENVEKHPWLLPIESWIVDHCKPGASQERRDEESAKRSNESPSFEVRFATIEDEQRAEGRAEILKRAKRPDSPKPDKSEKRKPELPSKVEDSGPAKVEVPPESKDAKHQDLFDKLRDNVKEKMEDIHRYFQRTNRLADVNRRLKSQIWSSVVTIVLVEAKNLLPMDIDGLSDPYVKFRLGTEKYKSKVVHKTLNPIWLEQFDLHLYEDPYLGQELEVTVWDRDKSHQDDLMGRTVIDLATLERETTHRLWRDLEDGSGSIFLLLTISGTTASETISDLAAHEETPREREQLYQRYAVFNTLQRIRDVGHLTVKVFRAQGLAAADLGGKSDPFCVLELVNARLQTQTEYKTLAPNWQKIFTFNVKDINSVLEVTVYDEDRDHKVEFLGKVAIPLLRIRNGEKRWYALKDKKLRGRAKGNSPQILLEMNVVWNVFRACVRTLNPKETKYMEPEIKFKRQVFLRNVLRLKAIIIIFIDIGKYVQSCWEWESKMRSVIALVFFVLCCYYFEPYMIPGAALLILLRYYLLYGDGSGLNQWISGQVAAITGTPLTHHTGSHFHDDGDDGPTTPGDDDDDDDDKDKEEKKSLKERLQAIQEVTQTVQNSIGYIASLCERVKNLFNFTVPYLSYLAIMLVILAAAVLYFIPVRYLILAWGVNKFFRKIVRPHSVPNNEVLDLVSRVPDDEELLNYRELKPLSTADCEKSGPSGSPGHSNLTRREQRKRQKAA